VSVRYISGHDVGSGVNYTVKLFFTSSIYTPGTYKELTDDVLSFNINRTLGSFLSPLRASTAEVKLDNHDGRYSPGRWPDLYQPNLELHIDGNFSLNPDGFVLDSSRLDINGFEGTTTFRLYTGFVDGYEIDASDTRGVEILTCRDIVKTLSTRMITTSPLTKTDVESAFAIVFSHAGVTNYEVASLGEVFGFYTLSRDTSALNAINGLLSAGGYFSFVTASGALAIKEPYFGTREKTATASYDSFMSLTYTFNDTSLYNRVKISGATRMPSAVGTIAVFVNTLAAFSQSVILLPKNASYDRDTLSFELAYRDYDNNQLSPAIGVITPVASKDYEFRNMADVVRNDMVTVTTSPGFETVKVTLQNNDTRNFYELKRLQVRGQPFRLQSDFSAQTDITSSQTVYGVREIDINAQYLSDRVFAQNYANRVSYMYHSNNPSGTAAMRNAFPSMLSLQPGDLIGLVNSRAGINSKHMVTAISHSVNAEENGWIHNMNISFELARTKVSSL
jgi:hypothetical protein